MGRTNNEERSVEFRGDIRSLRGIVHAGQPGIKKARGQVTRDLFPDEGRNPAQRACRNTTRLKKATGGACVTSTPAFFSQSIGFESRFRQIGNQRWDSRAAETQRLILCDDPFNSIMHASKQLVKPVVDFATSQCSPDVCRLPLSYR
jgi:hypothetical protein